MNPTPNYDLICGSMAVGIMLIYTWQRKTRGDYVCPSCGSKNGRHDSTCQWKRFYEDD